MMDVFQFMERNGKNLFFTSSDRSNDYPPTFRSRKERQRKREQIWKAITREDRVPKKKEK